MFIYELIIYMLSSIMIGVIISKKIFKRQYIYYLLGLTILFFSMHFTFDNPRWQLTTLYISFFLLVFTVYFRYFINISFNKYIRTSVLGLAILFIIVSIGAILVFPVYEMNLPSGDYSVGTESFIIEDGNRLELYSEESGNFRKIKIQFWYPAESTEGYENAPWLEDGKVVSRALARDFGLPSFVLDHTTDIMSNSFFEAPINEELSSYPVIVISHGWRGFRNLHTDFAEDLASLGYIVIGIDHSYGSVATVFSDDDIVYLNLDALPDRETTDEFLDYANQLVYTYASDITTTIDYLEEINKESSSSRFSGKLDLSNIGLLGHSTGGGADVAVALNDKRIGALIGLDAWVEPIEDSEITKGLSVPSLFIRSGDWEVGFNNVNLYSLIESSSTPSMLYQIDGTTHFDFSMVYMYSPFTQYLGFTGSVEGQYLNSIQKSMISDFFNENLKNDINSEIDLDKWEEVRNITIE